jgi:hypothetical protein
MADNVLITTGSSTNSATVLADELTDATLGTGKAQYIKIMDGTLDSSVKASVKTTAPSASADAGLVTRAVLYDAYANAISARPAGSLRVATEPSQIFYDPFDAALDTTNLWKPAVSSGGGVAGAVSAGNLTLATGTTANGYSYVETTSSFKPTVPGWIGYSFALKFPNPVVSNQYMFWGAGTSPGAPTTTAPLTDAVGFELATDGKLYAVVYAGGTRTQIADLSSATGNSKQPADNNFHRYIVYIRTDLSFFCIDTLDNVVAQTSFQAPQVQTLPVKLQAVAASVAPASSGVLTCAGLAVWDTAHNNFVISDGQYPFRKITVKPAQAAPALADTALVTTLHPNSSLPSGSAKIGSVDIATAAATAKGTQGANAVPTQDLKDAGRTQVHWYTTIPVTATATDTLQSLTGTRGSTIVAGTTTPTTVTAGKTFRITRFAASYIATATSGYGICRLRANSTGSVGIGSPIISTIAVGSSTPATANASGMEEASLGEGWELPTGAGIGISVQGFAGTTATAVGFVFVAVSGYEY